MQLLIIVKEIKTNFKIAGFFPFLNSIKKNIIYLHT